MKKLVSSFGIIFLYMTFSLVAFADGGILSIPDSADVRHTKLMESWITAPVSSLEGRESETFFNEYGQIFQIKSERAGDEIAICIYPRDDKSAFLFDDGTGGSFNADGSATSLQNSSINVASARANFTSIDDDDALVTGTGEELLGIEKSANTNATQNNAPSNASPARDYQFWAKAAGSWVLFRDAETGAYKRIHQYFTSDSNIYLVLTPDKNPKKPKSTADLVVYGVYAAKDVQIGLSFEDVASCSFADLYRLTQQTIPWKFVRYDPRKYTNTHIMVKKIRENLPRFEYIPDAGFDELLLPVFISSGEVRSETPGKLGVDCDGFVKWVVDGVTLGLNKKAIRLAPLKNHTVKIEDTQYASSADSLGVFKCFDWIRNLSTAAVTAATDKQFATDLSGTDVKIEPFALGLSADGTKRMVGFLQDTGYSIDLLRPLFFVLAATEPDIFYLGAVKTPHPSEPESWVFHHSVVFFPYFDASGMCRVTVFESGVETTFEDFIARNPGTYVYLCRVKSTDRFDPL